MKGRGESFLRIGSSGLKGFPEKSPAMKIREISDGLCTFRSRFRDALYPCPAYTIEGSINGQ